MFEWLFSPEALVALFTLTALEIVLGIDNIILISILVAKLPEKQRQPGRIIGLSLAPLIQNSGVNWQNSHVRHKLSRVLWIPIEGSRSIPLAERHIGTPILWQPSEQQERQLQRDWEELMDYIVLGQLDKINARLGEVLQLRPKGANSKSLTKGIGKHGEIIDTLPLGFYLRKAFTHEILQQFVQQHT